MIVINTETGERIAAFNLKNVKPDKYQMESFARGILDMMMKDMAEKRDRENMQHFWGMPPMSGGIPIFVSSK